jgi:hypothetical protein
MAIQPIDLQTLFTQLDKVGKNQVSQKEGLHIQQALQNIQIQKKTDEQILSVNETQDTGEGSQRVKDRGPRKKGEEPGEREEGGAGEGESGENDGTEHKVYIIRDPALGKNIDVSG